MRRMPPWLIWTLAVCVWWTAWAFGVYGHFVAKENHLHAEYADLERQKTQALQLLTATPRLVRQVDSLELEFQEVTKSFVRNNRLEQLLLGLKNRASHMGVEYTDIMPDINSILAIPADVTPGNENPGLKPVLVRLKAQGRFVLLGAWLDDIENRADFRRWGGCRWDSGPDDTKVNFFGEAVFWVVTSAEIL